MTCGQQPAVKWCKSLALFGNKPLPPTALAAATEKFIRRGGNGLQTTIVHSEDLTASQFAFMAGLKIKKTGKYADRPYLIEDEYSDDDVDDFDDSTGETTRSCTSSRSVPQIWDNDFWQSDAKHQQHHPSLMQACVHADINSATTPGPASPCRQSRSSSFIFKGRFKITLGNDDDNDASTLSLAPKSNVYEWKRKSATHTATAAAVV